MPSIIRIFISVLFVLAFADQSFSQSIITKYYKNRNLTKEVRQSKAKFSETIVVNADSTLTTEVKDLKTNEILRSETYKGTEPYGIWINKRSHETLRLDYNFNLNYASETCSNSSSAIKSNTVTDIFKDSAAINFIAPKISTGENSIGHFLAKNIRYPAPAQEKGIQGKVILIFVLNKSGVIENIRVFRGRNVLLDKEAVRVLRQLKFNNPALLNGQPVEICFALPVSFKLK